MAYQRSNIGPKRQQQFNYNPQTNPMIQQKPGVYAQHAQMTALGVQHRPQPQRYHQAQYAQRSMQQPQRYPSVQQQQSQNAQRYNQQQCNQFPSAQYLKKVGVQSQARVVYPHASRAGPKQPRQRMLPTQSIRPMRPMQPIQAMRPLHPLKPLPPLKPLTQLKPLQPLQPLQPRPQPVNYGYRNGLNTMQKQQSISSSKYPSQPQNIQNTFQNRTTNKRHFQPSAPSAHGYYPR
eukprot:1110229_1